MDPTCQPVSSLSLWRRWLRYGSGDVGASGREEGNRSRELWFYSARGSIPGHQQPPPESLAEIRAIGVVHLSEGDEPDAWGPRASEEVGMSDCAAGWMTRRARTPVKGREERVRYVADE